MKSAIRNGLLALALSAVLLPGADQNLVNFSAPDANFIMGVRLAEVASSPLVTTALAEAQRSNPQVQDLFSMLGANPFQYLDEVLIAAKIDAASASKEPNSVNPHTLTQRRRTLQEQLERTHERTQSFGCERGFAREEYAR